MRPPPLTTTSLLGMLILSGCGEAEPLFDIPIEVTCWSCPSEGVDLHVTASGETTHTEAFALLPEDRRRVIRIQEVRRGAYLMEFFVGSECRTAESRTIHVPVSDQDRHELRIGVTCGS